MSLFDKIFGSKTQKIQAEKYFKMLNAYTPVFTNWGGCIYESELVRSAIDARARNISKLEVQFVGSAKPMMMTRLERNPNEFQTWSQFLYRVSTILDCNNNAFIVPVEDKMGEILGVYPIYPTSYELIEYEKMPFIRFTFATGQQKTFELARVGIMTKFQYKNDFFGESNQALFPTMELINIQNQAIQEGVKSSATYRFMAQMDNFSMSTDLAKERKRFTEENLYDGQGGLLLFPNTYKDIKQIESKPFVVSSSQMNLIQENVYNYFGVNQDVLQNKTIGDAWEAFYEGAIEPFSIQLSDVMTKMLYTNRELGTGNRVMFTSNRLQYMSNTDKLSVSAQMADRGLMTRNEIRSIWNLPPLPAELGDSLPVRGEYYDLKEGEQNDAN